jgi:hypothetical protein
MPSSRMPGRDKTAIRPAFRNLPAANGRRNSNSHIPWYYKGIQTPTMERPARVYSFSIIVFAAFGLFVVPLSSAQESSGQVVSGPEVSADALAATDSVANTEDGQGRVATEQPQQWEPSREQEVIIEGLYSYGNYKIFASGYDEKLSRRAWNMIGTPGAISSRRRWIMWRSSCPLSYWTSR